MRIKNNLAYHHRAFYKEIMRIFLSILTMYIFLIFVSVMSFAQDSDAEDLDALLPTPISMPVNAPQNPIPLVPEIKVKTVVKNEVKNPISEITQEWFVEQFARANGFPSGECTMRAHYNNNFELVFKGKQGRLSALRIKNLNDEKNAIKGFVGLGLEQNSYGLQSKSYDGLIDASLLTVPAVAEKIMDIAAFRLRLGGKDYYFSTNGFKEGYAQLLTCQGENSIQTIPVVSSQASILPPKKDKNIDAMPAEPIEDVIYDSLDSVSGLDSPVELTIPSQNGSNVPLAMALPMIVPSDYTFNIDGNVDPMVPITWDDNQLWFDSLRKAIEPNGLTLFVNDTNIRIAQKGAKRDVVQASSQKNVNNPVPLFDNQNTEVFDENKWTAKQGDKISDVLKLWASQAGVKSEIEIDETLKAQKDYIILGSLDIAVNQLLNDVSANSAVKPSAIIDQGNGQITKISGYEGASMKNDVNPDLDWRALEGTELRKVLMRWAAKSDVDLIWNADEMFFVKKSVKSNVDFDEAVAGLIQQYNGQAVRPTASLNIDPNTGKKTLIVTSVKS